MTNRSLHLNKAFLLRPAYQDYLWGGTRLNDEFGKNADTDTLAESWECSMHPAGQSVVASGEHMGKNLGELVLSNPEILGTHMSELKELPILVKLIDAARDLSVQVHPSDADVDGFGKTEMWYILDAAPDAYIYYGLRRAMTEEEVRAAIDKGTLTRYLNKIKVKPNEVYFIPAGLIHAIGAGVLVAEVQENSDYTYRLYDFNRVDKNGQKRDLHIDKALSVASLEVAPEPGQPMRVLNYRPGLAKEFLCRCQYFIVERVLLNTGASTVECVEGKTTAESFNVLLCLDGSGTFDGNPFKKGDCIFVPAASTVELKGTATFICVSC